MDQLLHALWHTEYLFRMPFHRTAIILLADVGLELGWTKRSLKMIEDIMPQVKIKPVTIFHHLTHVFRL